MRPFLLRSVSFMLAVVLAMQVFGHGRAISQNSAFMPDTLVNLAFFYKPPANNDAASIAANFDTVILTGGDANFRDGLLANGFSSTIPQYFRSEGIQDPGDCISSPANNQVAYKPGDFCWISQNHPDWFLLDTNGNRMRTSPTSTYYRMDPGNTGWQEFFVTRALEFNEEAGWSGIYLDNVEASLTEIQRDGIIPARYPDHASYQAAVRRFLQYVYQNYSQRYNRLMVGNIIARLDEPGWFDYIQYMDGAMQERWAVGWNAARYVSEGRWLKDLDLAEKTQAQGKFIILMAPGTHSDTNRQTFAFASYLLISNGKAAFRYGEEDLYDQIWLYDNYKVDIGSPLGARYQVGTSWRRDFTGGTVTVDPINHTADIHVDSLELPGAGKYDDGHPNWSYTGTWLLYNASGPYNDTLHYTYATGDSASFPFQGTQFILTYAQDFSRGSYDIYVDGNWIATIDANGPLEWGKTFTSPTFSPGTHLVRFQNSGGGGGVMDVDAIEVK